LKGLTVGKKSTTFELDLPVEFGGFSYGGNETCRIGIKIDRSVCNLVAADESFCGHRLTGSLLLGHHDEMPGQTRLFDSEDKVITGVFDVKRVGLSPEQITFGATFNEKEIDVALLCSFAKCKGRLLVESIAEIPEESGEGGEEAPSETGILPGALKFDGEWAKAKLSTLLKKSIAAKLAKAKLTTMGELAAYTAKDKQLTDIAGIGPGAASQIEEMTLAFFRDNSVETEEPANA
jgi:hypothetical protein